MLSTEDEYRRVVTHTAFHCNNAEYQGLRDSYHDVDDAKPAPEAVVSRYHDSNTPARALPWFLRKEYATAEL